MTLIHFMLKCEHVQFMIPYFVYVWTEYCLSLSHTCDTRLTVPLITEIEHKDIFNELTEMERQNFYQIKDYQL